jgi:hypothetical protein
MTPETWGNNNEYRIRTGNRGSWVMEQTQSDIYILRNFCHCEKIEMGKTSFLGNRKNEYHTLQETMVLGTHPKIGAHCMALPCTVLLIQSTSYSLTIF